MCGRSARCRRGRYCAMDIRLVASFAVITTDPALVKVIFVETIGLPLRPPVSVPNSEYVSSEDVAGAQHCGVWPLNEAAQTCFGLDTWRDTHPVPQATSSSRSMTLRLRRKIWSTAATAWRKRRESSPGNRKLLGSRQPMVSSWASAPHRGCPKVDRRPNGERWPGQMRTSPSAADPRALTRTLRGRSARADAHTMRHVRTFPRQQNSCLDSERARD